MLNNSGLKFELFNCDIKLGSSKIIIIYRTSVIDSQLTYFRLAGSLQEKKMHVVNRFVVVYKGKISLTLDNPFFSYR